MSRSNNPFAFEDTPNESDLGFPWTVKRTPAQGSLEMVCLSHRHVGVRTHYFRNRTIGCRRSECDACLHGNRSRWTGYLLCQQLPTGTKLLFEFTPTAVQFLIPLYEKHESIRGIKIQAFRPSRKTNGTITLSFRGFVAHPDQLPDAPEIRPLLFHIWGVLDDNPAAAAAAADAPMTECEKLSTYTKRRRNGSASPQADQILKELEGQLRLPGAE